MIKILIPHANVMQLKKVSKNVQYIIVCCLEVLGVTALFYVIILKNPFHYTTWYVLSMVLCTRMYNQLNDVRFKL